MRHIPEDELHAYLDQALSRSQCVEIECHLARCARCAGDRDRVAAIRDRTTALLAAAAPRVGRPPPEFEQLVARHLARRDRRALVLGRLARASGLAAALAGAVAAGWWSRGRLAGSAPAAPMVEVAAVDQPAVPTPVAAPATPRVPSAPEGAPGERALVALGEAEPLGETGPGEPPPAGRRTEPAAMPTASVERSGVLPVLARAAPLAVEVISLDAGDETPGLTLSGLWQSVDWQTAWILTGGNLPRIGGLPVLDVQVQRAADDARPLVIVSQQHPSGHVVRTIEGPVDRVAALVEGDGRRRFNASAVSFTPPDYLADEAGNARRSLRILTVTGVLPPDTLNALAQNIGMRE